MPVLKIAYVDSSPVARARSSTGWKLRSVAASTSGTSLPPAGSPVSAGEDTSRSTDEGTEK